MNIKKINKFWCDYCSVNKWDGEISKVCYYSTSLSADIAKHYRSKKHMKCVEIAKNDPNKVTCIHCSKDFTKEGYECHKERNNHYWKILESESIKAKYFRECDGFKNVSCNNFEYNGIRYESALQVYDAYRGNPIRAWPPKDLYIEVEPTKEEIKEEIKVIKLEEWKSLPTDVQRPTFDETCYGCGLPENNEEYRDDLLNLFDVQVCKCLEED